MVIMKVIVNECGSDVGDDEWFIMIIMMVVIVNESDDGGEWISK